MTDLAGKIIVVTGGASGIGLATVERLAGLGAVLVVGDLGAEPSPALQKLITRYDEGLSYAPLDVSSRESAHRFMEAVMNKHGRVDGLVNNAGICPNEGEMASDELYDRIMAVNLKGVWHMGTEAITVMKNQTASEGVKGVIVNTASDAALKGIRGIAAYTASKHGVLGLTRTWCKDWTPVGIRVNAVAPGVTDTPMVAGIAANHDTGPDNVKSWMANIPMGRFARPDEIAGVICFLLSDQSSFMSGQCVRVGGGEGE